MLWELQHATDQLKEMEHKVKEVGREEMVGKRGNPINHLMLRIRLLGGKNCIRSFCIAS